MDCKTELEFRTINGGSDQAPLQGPGTFLIQRNLATCTRVKEICVQPAGATNVQLVEGGNASSSTSIPQGGKAMSALWSLSAGQPWSAPGKRIKADLYIIITAAVQVQVEVRYEIPECQ